MSIESRLERLEGAAGGGGDVWLHVAQLLKDGSVQMRKKNGEPYIATLDEYHMIDIRYGKQHPFILLGADLLAVTTRDGQ